MTEKAEKVDTPVWVEVFSAVKMANGNLAAFDASGHQIPSMQGAFARGVEVDLLQTIQTLLRVNSNCKLSVSILNR